MDYITGRSGFIGSRLYERLSDRVWFPHATLAYARLKPFDHFYFLSTYGNMYGQNDIKSIVQANVLDLLGIIEQIHEGTLVYISTSSVLLRVQTPYSRSKRIAEELILSHDIHACIPRLFSVTGVGEQKEHLIPTLIRSCLHGEGMDFVPKATHDFVDVEDAVDAILSLAPLRGVFEVGSGVSYSNEEVLSLVEEVTGKKANVRIVPSLRPYDNQEWVSRNFSAREYWKPRKTLKQTIEEMVDASIL